MVHGFLNGNRTPDPSGAVEGSYSAGSYKVDLWCILAGMLHTNANIPWSGRLKSKTCMKAFSLIARKNRCEESPSPAVHECVARIGDLLRTVSVAVPTNRVILMNARLHAECKRFIALGRKIGHLAYET